MTNMLTLIMFAVVVTILLIIHIKRKDDEFKRKLEQEFQETLVAITSALPCTGLIEVTGYDQSANCSTESVIQFKTEVLLEHIKREYKEDLSGVELIRENDRALCWIRNGDLTIEAISRPPAILGNLQHLTHELLLNQQGVVHCNRCKRDYQANQLKYAPHTGGIGWNYDSFWCSEGHLISKGNQLIVCGVYNQK
jgi:hypothetical protein